MHYSLPIWNSMMSISCTRRLAEIGGRYDEKDIYLA
jgi:hypothetical protein